MDICMNYIDSTELNKDDFPIQNKYSRRMLIIGITGTLGAGKGTVVEYLRTQRQFAYFSVRQFLMEEVHRRGMEPNRDSLTFVANDLRQKHSPSYIVDELYKQAADKGHIPAMISYATCLLNGTGVEENKGEAVKYFHKAADRGSADAQLSYAYFLQDGDLVKKDLAKAAEYMKKAADQFNIDAEYAYAMTLMTGNGVEKDEKKAVQYFKQSADQGSLQGMYEYAKCLEEGIGIKKNVKEAVMLYEAAGDKGHRPSREAYLRLTPPTQAGPQGH